ncbi:nuclease-related domain-containing protein [Fictibacillus sp. NPDC058756]|uniref:nuclease-related domain-containing protein n=1 Tax=Fictibacillus sp. NPDC058756 TaxID=3346625 RepID=UPI0036C562C3
MSKIELKPPIIIKKLDVLLKRSSPTHYKRPQIIESHRRFKAGYSGEQSLKYFYRYLPNDNVLYLPALRIMDDEYYFQMDQLIVTSNFLLILEIKNLAGYLYFDDKVKQLIRTLDGKKECFEDPIEQVRRQSYHLEKILKQLKFPIIPIERLVIITNPATIVEFSPTYKEAFAKVIKSAQLHHKFTEFQQKYQTPMLTSKEMKKLSKQLFKLHDAHDPDVCDLFEMDKRELLKGVLCPKCDQPFIMYYKGANWWCPNCPHKSKTAHIEALKDYALIISTTITNREFKYFLHLPSTSITTHLLKALNLPYTGSTKSRSYNLLPLLNLK